MNRCSVGIGVGVACAFLAVACGSTPQTGGENSPSPAAAAGEHTASLDQGISAAPIYVKALSAEHVIEFYEFGPGATVVREVGPIGAADGPRVPSLAFSSLAELYTQLNPTETAVPSALLQADQRATQLEADRQATAKSSPAAGLVKPEVPTGRNSSQIGQEILSGADGCSSDVNGDGWSGDWFINNFCNAGGFRWCQKNFPNANWNGFSHSWVSWRQMEGDWNLNGHITLQRCDCGIFACGCPNKTDVDHDVLARHYEIWNWNPASNAYAFSTSQCGHEHIDVLWNN